MDHIQISDVSSKTLHFNNCISKFYQDNEDDDDASGSEEMRYKVFIYVSFII